METGVPDKQGFDGDEGWLVESEVMAGSSTSISDLVVVAESEG